MKIELHRCYRYYDLISNIEVVKFIQITPNELLVILWSCWNKNNSDGNSTLLGSSHFKHTIKLIKFPQPASDRLED